MDTTTSVAPPVIEKPKPNSYYYWHGHEKERAVLGDVAPKTSPQLVKSEAVAECSPILKVSPITKYAWCNNTSSVSVYVDREDGVQTELTAEMIRFEVTAKRLKLAIHPTSTATQYGLVLHLAKEVNPDKSTWRIKEGKQVVIKLVKANDETWYDLTDNKVHNDDE